MNTVQWALLGVVIVLQVALWVRMAGKPAGRHALDGEMRRELDLLRSEVAGAIERAVAGVRQEYAAQAKLLREELAGQIQRLSEATQAGFGRMTSQVNEATAYQLHRMGEQQRVLLEAFAGQLKHLADTNEQRLEAVRQVVDARLRQLQEDNSRQMERMRQTVDEKLHATLEQRLAASFRQVSDRLEAVHRGLGEMQSLAANVGDLKRVLTNVKARGTFGEVQLEMLLAQLLSPEQYEKNVAVRAGSNERVEFAIRLPGQGGADAVYLPIDCKFPMEDYQRMLDAQDAGDAAAFQEAARALHQRIRAEARSIHDKYIQPPHTTDFALMYLPTEGLFAEVLRQSGLAEAIQREYRVVLAGPTTLTALLNSLQMGFRTLAIQKRSSEVWELLGAIKAQFGTFGELLQKTQKKLQEASRSIETATRRTRTIERRLERVQELPAEEAARLLPPDPDTAAEEA
ncbi:DNA recombination protein RmuC [Alicyclobacillus sp.]|uniref:DNA recombination protein RmuC n=1 Tax=Alicyclobacillus sp. TaxID=61169 RepID=UPI0025B814BD|nr:DNA recombination protein RmuC [Alicyclobacillus sp.]MCL6516251.1 DNA recombination protein RmuC [Alicyclobacillus sp.]